MAPSMLSPEVAGAAAVPQAEDGPQHTGRRSGAGSGGGDSLGGHPPVAGGRRTPGGGGGGGGGGGPTADATVGDHHVERGAAGGGSHAFNGLDHLVSLDDLRRRVQSLVTAADRFDGLCCH